MKFIFIIIFLNILSLELNAQESSYYVYFEEKKLDITNDSLKATKIALDCLKRNKTNDPDGDWRMKDVVVVKKPKNTFYNDSIYSLYCREYDHLDRMISELQLNVDSLISYRQFRSPTSNFEVYYYLLKNDSLKLHQYKKFGNLFLEFEIQFVDSLLTFVDFYKNGYKTGTSYHLFKDRITWECHFKDSFNFINFEKWYYINGKVRSIKDYNKLCWTFYSEDSIITKVEKIDIYGNILDLNGNVVKD